MATELRVALLASEYPPHVFGGLGTHVRNVTDAMGDAVIQHLFTPLRGNYASDNPSVQIHEVPVLEASTNVEFWLRYSQATANMLRQATGPLDLIHAHDWMTVLAGIKLREEMGLPLVYNIHLPQTPGPHYHQENLGLVVADVVVVNSQAVRDELLARGLPIRRIEVVPNGVSRAHFMPSPGWPVADPYVLFVGRLVPQKGVDQLLRAFSVVLRRCPDSRLVVVGDGELALYLKRVARHLGVSQHVSFVQWKSGPELLHYYQQAQVVVVPSNYEPFGLVALEAMACGRPVVASAVGGLQEIIEDGMQGYLVPPGDYLAMAQRLANLLLNPALRQQMGKTGIEQAASYGWENTAQRTLQIYRQLVSQPVEPASRQRVFELATSLKTILNDTALNDIVDTLLAPIMQSGQMMAGEKLS